MAANNSIKSILETALEREKKGHAFYNKAASETGSEKARHMFDWLMSVEQTHIDKLSKQLDALSKTGKFIEMQHAVPRRVGSADLPAVPEVSGKVTPDTGELQALEMGMKAEKEAAAFYAAASQNAEDKEARILLEHLAGDEREHLAVLEEEYNWLKKSGEYFTIHRFQLPAR
ncbi:MAG: ferritin family protein [Chloroflexi bacterium]|nr:ferritin family protein [Chloroflexota bacterium]